MIKKQRKLMAAVTALLAAGTIGGAIAVADAAPLPNPATVTDPAEPGDAPDAVDTPEPGDTPDSPAFGHQHHSGIRDDGRDSPDAPGAGERDNAQYGDHNGPEAPGARGR